MGRALRRARYLFADGTSDALALNQAGQIAGDAASADGSVDRAVVWTPTGSGSYSLTDLGTLPGDTLGFANAIDSNGRVAGLSASETADTHGAVWSPTGSGSFSVDLLEPLPGNASSVATAINDAGLVAGSSFGPAGPERAVAWITEQ